MKLPLAVTALVAGGIPLVATISLAAQAMRDGPAVAAHSEMHVYKFPACVCCGRWIEHAQDAGFVVTVHNETNMASKKAELGVPRELFSCHTSVVDGKVVEGHTPTSAIRKMLSGEGTTLAGIGVAGMPAGSPGMQEDGSAFTVHAFSVAGETSVYQAY